MGPDEAYGVLGVARGASRGEVRRAYLARIRDHHPDRTGRGTAEAVRIIEAYRVLRTAAPPGVAEAPPPPPPPEPPVPAGTLARSAGDTLLLGVPADEAFRLLLDAAHDVGEVTYLDRSGPILEVLCRFVGEPATSLVLTVQGRAGGTEVFCTATSIEARPGPPTDAVVDLLEDALRRRG